MKMFPGRSPVYLQNGHVIEHILVQTYLDQHLIHCYKYIVPVCTNIDI